MSSDSFWAVISVLCRFFSCSRCCAEGRFHPHELLAEPVGFAQRLLVVVGHGGQERRDFHRVETAECPCETLLAEVERADIHSVIVLPSRLIGRRVRPTESTDERRRSRVGPAPEKGGPDADERGALLDGDLEVVAHPHRQLARASTGRRRAPAGARGRPRSARKNGPRRFRIVDRRRQQHQARPRARRRAARAAAKIAGQLVFARAVLGRLAGQIHLHQHVELASGGRAPLRRASRPARRCRSSGRRRSVPAFFALFDWRWPTRCQRSGRSDRLRPSSAALPGPCSRRSRSGRRRPARERSRREMSWRRRRGGWRRGRARPGRPPARCASGRRPAGPGAQRRRSLLLQRRRGSPSRSPRSARSARASGTFRTRSRRRRGCPRSPAPCRADSAPRRGSGSRRSRLRTASSRRRSCRRSRG